MQKAYAHCRDMKIFKTMLGNAAFFWLNSYFYRLSGMLNLILSSFLKPEVEIRAFLRMRSGNTTKIGLKSRFFG